MYLCQSGDVELSIKSLGYNFRSHTIPPRFPMFVHETFKIEGCFNNVQSIQKLENILGKEVVFI